MKARKETAPLPPLDDMYQSWHIKLRFRNGIVGGQSLSGSTARQYAELLSTGSSNQLKKALKENGVITKEDIAGWLDKNTQVFPMDADGPYVGAYQISSMLYQAGCRGNIPGIKTGNPGAALRGAGHIVPTRIPFQGDWHLHIDEHTIRVDRAGHKTSAISIFQVAEGVELEFETKILRQPSHLPEDVYRRLWHLAQEEGLGSRRELGHGKFDLLAIDRLD